MKAKVPHWRQLLSWRWGNHIEQGMGAAFPVLSVHEPEAKACSSECAAVSKRRVRVWCAIKQ
jgi:hypothetical protein